MPDSRRVTLVSHPKQGPAADVIPEAVRRLQLGHSRDNTRLNYEAISRKRTSRTLVEGIHYSPKKKSRLPFSSPVAPKKAPAFSFAPMGFILLGMARKKPRRGYWIS